MALSRAEIQQAAERILADYDAGRANQIFAERGTDWLSLEEAYLVQRTVAELRRQRGENCVGYKIGCISPTIQAQFGLGEPVSGYLWMGEMLPSGSHLRVGPSATEGRRFVNLAIEGEIAIRLACPVESSMPFAALAQCVERWFPVIELHNYVFRGPSATSQELVAGNAMHAGFLVPLPTPGQSAPFSDQAEIRIEINRELVEAKLTSEVPGGPLGSVRWLASSLGLRTEMLRAGDILLTGSPGRLVRVSAFSHIVVLCAEQRVELFVDDIAS
jgi:2-keto-4-pentenoate hydratase